MKTTAATPSIINRSNSADFVARLERGRHRRMIKTVVGAVVGSLIAGPVGAAAGAVAGAAVRRGPIRRKSEVP